MNRKSYNLGESPSLKFNNELKNIIKHCRFCQTCDEEQYFIGNYGIKVLCYYFVNNLEKTYQKIENNEKLKDKRCNDFIYWWYDNLYYTYEKGYSPDFADIINQFKKIWKNITQSYGVPADKLCKNPFEPLLSLDSCKNMKKVSDYCENYEFIKKELEETSANCAGYYYYLTQSEELYNETVSKCKTDGKKYCLNFDQCHTYDPKILLNNYKCKLIERTENEDAELAQKAEHLIMCPLDYDCVPDYISKMSITFSDYRFISLMALSLWAIILSCFFLYKFTPFGSFLNNILNRKNSFKKNIHEEEFLETLDSDIEDSPINFNNREYRITYNHD
ncbi:PIR Superfamily Protein [Plasmodium ovale wallikeri]|uniref:PIR Superfamily Protein n=2 Tax=Plasmodium ovale TaxID=36330 RepID=A0A1A9API7_PLAOA|nr:PIR Superfamily Protein [Plasmodium ovale wallikeri]SBT59569.1 PIR Superfamily Protein [Plasmodium ovale wallikeri]SBT73892.1 PIR protein [Plasmodium ovale]